MSATNRQRLREAIMQTGRDQISADDVGRLAIELSSRFPQSGLTIETIEDELRTASREKAENKAEIETIS